MLECVPCCRNSGLYTDTASPILCNNRTQTFETLNLLHSMSINCDVNNTIPVPVKYLRPHPVNINPYAEYLIVGISFNLFISPCNPIHALATIPRPSVNPTSSTILPTPIQNT